jgi:hypothetical protein
LTVTPNPQQPHSISCNHSIRLLVL